jgi:hypothetical protein
MDQGNDVRSPKSSLLTGEGASGSKSNSASDHIKAPPRDDFARQEPRRGRKLRTVVGAIAVLGLGWVIGLNSQFDIAQSKVWLDQGAINLSSAWTSLQRGFVDRVEHLAGRNTPAAEGAFGENKPNNADALERVADNLGSKLDQMRASSEGLARDLTVELERLRGSMDRSQGELVAKFTQLAERVERLEQTQPSAQAAQTPEHTAVAPPTAPTAPPVPRLATTPERPKVVPPPTQAGIRREPTVIKQWRVREVLNGTAFLEGPGGSIGVSRGETVPGIGRVESIVRSGNRWVVATSKGVITGN